MSTSEKIVWTFYKMITAVLIAVLITWWNELAAPVKFGMLYGAIFLVLQFFDILKTLPE